MSGKVTDTDRGAKAFAERIKALAASTARVRVGVLADAPKQEHASVGAEGGTAAPKPVTLIEVAGWHEFGAPDANIPQRSFIRGTVDEKRDDIARLEAVLLENVVTGKITEDQALDQLGAKVAGMVQTRISQGIPPALAQATIDRKKSSVPLVDTGQLRSAITWQVG